MKKTKAIIIGDFGKDLDDEHTLVLAAGLIKSGHLDLLGVIANLNPADERAQIARGTLKQLGLDNIPVGCGSNVSDTGSESYEFDISYMSKENIESGDNLLLRLFNDAKENSITLILQSALTDVTNFLRANENLFIKKIKEVVIMGGVQTEENEILKTGNFIQPDSSNNITFDWANGCFLYAKLQELKVPMVILTRHAAYSAQIPFSVYDKMEATGNIIGIELKARQSKSLESLFDAACSEEGSSIRGTLPPRCNKQWFIDTFLEGEWTDSFQVPKVINYYDPMNLIAGIQSLREEFFKPVVSNVLGQNHLIIGVSLKRNNIKNPSKLVDFIVDTEVDGLL